MNNKKTSPVLHLMCGLPCSGKTTLAKQLSKEFNGVRFSPDEWLYELGLDFYDDEARIRVEKLQWQFAQELLKSGNSVILENGFWLKIERENFRSIASQWGITTKIHFLDTSLKELENRLIKRNKLFIPTVPKVNPDNLAKWAALFEPPTKEELLYDIHSIKQF